MPRKTYNIKKFYPIISLLILIIFILTDNAFASSEPVASRLCSFSSLLRGNIAKAIATLSVMAAGAKMLTGKFDVQSFAPVIIGILIIFLSPSIVQAITGITIQAC